MDRTKLRDLLVKYFSDDDLRDLCFEMGVDYDDLKVQDRAGKARELIIYFTYHGQLPELLEKAKKLRPKVPWGDDDVAPDPLQEEIKSLRRQLAEKESDLLDIEEKKSEYIMETDIPLSLKKQERKTRKKIADLRAQLEELHQKVE